MNKLAITKDGFKYGVISGSLFISNNEGTTPGVVYRESQYLLLGTTDTEKYRTAYFNRFTLSKMADEVIVESNKITVTMNRVTKVFQGPARN